MEESTELSSSSKIHLCRNVGCIKKYSSTSARAVHERKCNKPKGSPRKKAKKVDDFYYCRYCRKQFKIQTSVYRHQKVCNAARVLNGKRPIMKKKKTKIYRCHICSKVFDRQGKLEKHVNSHLSELFLL